MGLSEKLSPPFFNFHGLYQGKFQSIIQKGLLMFVTLVDVIGH
jgi:hypothetical protein